MPYKDPVKRKEYSKEYSKEYNKEWRKNNKDYFKEYGKEWYKNNKEHIKEYKQTTAGKKSNTISRWKSTNLICDNIEALYEHYINTWECENCGIELVTGNTAPNFRCMDHCHKTGKFRNILCHSCNIQRGYDDNSNLIGS